MIQVCNSLNDRLLHLWFYKLHLWVITDFFKKQIFQKMSMGCLRKSICLTCMTLWVEFLEPKEVGREEEKEWMNEWVNEWVKGRGRDRNTVNSNLFLNQTSLKFFLFYIYIWVHCSCLQTHQKRASDPITYGCEPPCGYWELNSGPLGKAVGALNCWANSPAPKDFCSISGF